MVYMKMKWLNGREQSYQHQFSNLVQFSVQMHTSMYVYRWTNVKANLMAVLPISFTAVAKFVGKSVCTHMGKPVPWALPYKISEAYNLTTSLFDLFTFKTPKNQKLGKLCYLLISLEAVYVCA